MAIRRIAVRGDEILRKKCKPVKEVTERTKVLAEDMIETMKNAEGIGLAASQVGVMKRIFVARPHIDDEEKIYVMINPEIYAEEGVQDSAEGCLSVPGVTGFVERPRKIKIRATDLDGKEHEYEFEDFEATVICHEYDHLNGIIYTDKASRVFSNEEFQDMIEYENGKNDNNAG